MYTAKVTVYSEIHSKQISAR